jgi:hypothetical protein
MYNIIKSQTPSRHFRRIKKAIKNFDINFQIFRKNMQAKRTEKNRLLRAITAYNNKGEEKFRRISDEVA